MEPHWSERNVDSTYICTYLCKSCYVCYLPYLPSPIPTPPNPSASRVGGSKEYYSTVFPFPRVSPIGGGGVQTPVTRVTPAPFKVHVMR